MTVNDHKQSFESVYDTVYWNTVTMGHTHRHLTHNCRIHRMNIASVVCGLLTRKHLPWRRRQIHRTIAFMHKPPETRRFIRETAWFLIVSTSARKSLFLPALRQEWGRLASSSSSRELG